MEDSYIMDEEREEPSTSQVTAGPSENELRLGRKVHELEKERDAVAAKLFALKSRYPVHGTTIPIPSESPKQPLTVPNELLPVLALLRSHVANLTRDNQALRYTFLGQPEVPDVASSTASSSKVTLDVLSPRSGTSQPATTTSASVAGGLSGGVSGVDLGTVALRVKELLKENEELGEMILQAGRTGGEEWQKALDESKAVISSLDSDLNHQLGVITNLRSELETYKTHFGSLPKDTDTTCVPGSSHRASDLRGERSDRRGSTTSRDDRRKDVRTRREEKDGNHPRDRDKERSGRENETSGRGHERSQGSRSGGHRGGRSDTNGPRGGKDDDRAWKRRR